MNELLRRRAEEQGGVFTWGDVRSCLLGEHEVRTALRRGEAVHLRRDAYVLADAWQAARPAERLALRVRAVLRTRPDDLASHQSALALHGVSLWGVPTDTVDLASPVSRSRTSSGVRLHPRGALAAVDSPCGPTVGVAVAVVQVALRTGLTPAVVSLDHALHTRLCHLTQVQTAAGQLARGPLDRARLEQLLALADAASESVGESRTRLLLRGLGYEVRSQVTVRDADGLFTGRVDFMIEGAVVVEFDGLVKYDGVEGRAALAREKAREERLTALGCVVVRLVWADLDQPERVRARIEAALARLAR